MRRDSETANWLKSSHRPSREYCEHKEWIRLPRGDWDGHQKVGSGNDSKGYIIFIIYEGPIHIEDEQNRSVAVYFPVNHLLLISLLRDR